MQPECGDETPKAWEQATAVVVTLTLFAALGCSESQDALETPKEQLLAQALVGAWYGQADASETEYGRDTAVTITFMSDGQVTVTIVTGRGDDAQSTSVSGTYLLKDGKLVSEVFDKGRPVSVTIKGQKLILKLRDGYVAEYTRLVHENKQGMNRDK